ncbi:MAG: type I restriction endonuclease [Phormidesmis sp.]
MAKVVAVTQSASSLAEVEARFNLSRNQDMAFFPEWQAPFSEVSEKEAGSLDLVYRRLQYHRADGELLEGAVTLLVVSPLLELADLYDPPFKLKSEASIEIAVDDGEETLRGRIDALILQNQLWVIVVEAKKTTIPLRSALPQLLTYLMANPIPDRSVFGLITNGDEVLFVKLSQTPAAQYDISRAFSLYTVRSELTQVLQILKKISKIIA